MRKLHLVLFLLVTILSLNAQDVIVKKDGTTVLCKIYEVNGTDIVYKKWSDLNGDKYIMDRSIVSVINYQDGRQDKLNEQTFNNYSPGIQQSGAAAYNDNSLLSIDYARVNNPYLKRAKRLRIIGWTAGSALLASGIIMMAVGEHERVSESHGPGFFKERVSAAGFGVAVAGVLTTGTCLIFANNIQKKADKMTVSSLMEYDFKLGNNSRLTAGIDVFQNQHLNKINYGLGLGLKLNF